MLVYFGFKILKKLGQFVLDKKYKAGVIKNGHTHNRPPLGVTWECLAQEQEQPDLITCTLSFSSETEFCMC